MSPEIFYWLALAVKIAIGAGVVIAATVAAERLGPVVGALIATLPVSAGPAYFFLAFEQDAAFISQSALGSLVLNASTAIYAATYVMLAQRQPFLIAVPSAVIAWLGSLYVFSLLGRTALSATLINVVAFAAAYYAVRPYRAVRMPRLPLRWYDLAIRAGMVGTIVGVIVALNAVLGPRATGALAAFPIIFTSIMFILHRRFGGPACAAVMANGIIGLVGFGIAALILHLTTVPLGVPAALLLALAITVAWNFSLYLVRPRSAAA